MYEGYVLAMIKTGSLCIQHLDLLFCDGMENKVGKKLPQNISSPCTLSQELVGT
jgi:hypothetical protein